MPGDLVISDPSVEPAPKDYTVPASQRFIVKQVQALFTDNGAAGDWLPALEVLSDAGIVTGRYVGESVAAGAGQEVTFHPLGSKGGAAATGIPSLPQAFAGRISTDQTLAKNAITTITFDALTTNDSSVFTGLNGASQVVSVASAGVYLMWARIEFNVINDGNHELVVVATATPNASSLSRVVRSDFPGQDQRFSKDTFYPLSLATYQLVTAFGDTGQFSLQFVSTGATIDATGRGRLHMVRLGDLMI